MYQFNLLLDDITITSNIDAKLSAYMLLVESMISHL